MRRTQRHGRPSRRTLANFRRIRPMRSGLNRTRFSRNRLDGRRDLTQRTIPSCCYLSVIRSDIHYARREPEPSWENDRGINLVWIRNAAAGADRQCVPPAGRAWALEIGPHLDELRVYAIGLV